MPPTSPAAEVTLAPPARPEDLSAAAEFGITVAAARDPSTWQIRRHLGRLALHEPAELGGLVLDLGFDTADLRRRLQTARRTDPLPRAVGLNRKDRTPTVVDATGGLCRDAAVLSWLGCPVTALERVPALAMLACVAARDARLPGGPTVVLADAVAWLRNLPEHQRPDVVCLDPMFEDTGKAQVKKEMQVCRHLCGSGDEDFVDLFAAARAVARERVVVKRHGKAAPLAAGVSFAVPGERVRFDVYLTGQPGNPPGSPPGA